jgi:hypothetical protein
MIDNTVKTIYDGILRDLNFLVSGTHWLASGNCVVARIARHTVL